MVTDTPGNENTIAPAPEQKSFLEQAQEAIEGAVESTLEAVKEHPIAAAAIAAGAAAAVGGAAYAASQMFGDKGGDTGKKD